MSDDFPILPEAVRHHLEPRLADFDQALAQAGFRLTEAQRYELLQVWAGSDFVMRACISRPQLVRELFDSGDLHRDYAEHTHAQTLRRQLAGTEDVDELGVVLRRFRQREMVRIAWRDLMAYADLDVVLHELSWLAESCVAEASACLQGWLEQKHGQPRDSEGRPLNLVVLGMGKLGAHELNFSSDIDLIFTYAEDGETQGDGRKLEHAEFFQRLARQLVKALNELTAEGFVFRVDTRLRPFGASGQLVLSFNAMEAYYETHGREWERYALIKARPVAGEAVAAAELMDRLKPFVYRRYLDFGAFESLREMKRMINAEVSRKGLEDNVKLGPGGIREIEFIGQAFQLIRGGREPRLQQREILNILSQLALLDLLPDYVVDHLTSAYIFLRRLENRIQAFADQQTHDLPQQDLDRQRLAFAMGFADWPALMSELQQHRNRVDEHFQQVFASPQLEPSAPTQDADKALVELWQGRLAEEQALTLLAELGFDDSREAYRLITLTREGAACRAMGPKGQERLEKLIPLLLAAVARTLEPLTCLLRVLHLLEAIVRRSAYLALLAEHPMAVSQLVKLFDQSPWIADQLSRYPVLLDELLDSRRLYEPLSKADMARELNSRLRGLEAGDVETEMEILRQFKQAHALRVAAAELTGAMPVEKVSDHLSFLAEVVLEQVLESASQTLRQRFGWPHYRLDGELHPAGFVIIGYGKLGGLELGFGSDLDLVFLHDSQGEQQQTTGERSIDNAVFFARLGQRIISLLTTLTASGKLYEVDTRLRPSGASGLLVSSLASFSDYQHKQAWTWEHQALVRARPVAGSPALSDAFQQLRRQVLAIARDGQSLAQDVVQMRRRMRESLDKSQADTFDIKHGHGGVVDIEFLIQFMILRCAEEYPELSRYTDNLRLLESLAKAKLLPGDDAKMLARAYLAYRHKLHELSLQQAPSVTDEQQFQSYRDAVNKLWNAFLPGD